MGVGWLFLEFDFDIEFFEGFVGFLRFLRVLKNKSVRAKGIKSRDRKVCV